MLDSLVVFAGVGDMLDVVPSATARLEVVGAEADGVPSGNDNLAARAAALTANAQPVAITLEKRLPAAAGIGGGSADAAAALRAVAVLTGRPLPPVHSVLALGADVPVCLDPGPQRVTGIGEGLQPLPPLPALGLVLVNPRVPTSTARVFAALGSTFGAPMPAELPVWRDAADLAGWLALQRNDLEAPARGLVQEIGVVLERLAAVAGCRVARMSGSGATCFGIFDGFARAREAAAILRTDKSQWWVVAAPILGPRLARDQARRATT